MKRDPISLLPANLRAFARGRADLVILAGWILLACGWGIFGRAGAASISQGGISVGGEDGFELSRARDGFVFTQGARRVEIVRTGERLSARQADGTPALEGSVDEDGVILRNAAGGVAFRLKRKDDGGLSFRDGSGAVLYRVKVKPDKVNLYDGDDQRIRYAKEKHGRILVRDAQGSDLFTIDGISDLEDAGVLALPLPALARALFFVSSR